MTAESVFGLSLGLGLSFGLGAPHDAVMISTTSSSGSEELWQHLISHRCRQQLQSALCRKLVLPLLLCYVLCSTPQYVLVRRGTLSLLPFSLRPLGLGLGTFGEVFLRGLQIQRKHRGNISFIFGQIQRRRGAGEIHQGIGIL